MGTIKTFKYSELSEEVREKVRQHDAENQGYHRDTDALASLGALAEHFGGTLSDYSIDFFATSHSSATFDMPEEMDREEIKERLEKLGSYDQETFRGDGDCKLTGYCSDDDAIDGFRKAFYGGENDLDKLMQAGFDTWLKACQKDCEYLYSDEVYSENEDANDNEYLADGKFVTNEMKSE